MVTFVNKHMAHLLSVFFGEYLKLGASTKRLEFRNVLVARSQTRAQVAQVPNSRTLQTTSCVRVCVCVCVCVCVSVSTLSASLTLLHALSKANRNQNSRLFSTVRGIAKKVDRGVKSVEQRRTTNDERHADVFIAAVVVTQIGGVFRREGEKKAERERERERERCRHGR